MPQDGLVPYDSNWPAAFEAERDRLITALAKIALRVDHHGSTAVPGLAAKPIIDIQVSVARLHPMTLYGRRLMMLGYQHVPHEDDGLCPFFHRPSTWPHTHYVHVVEAGGVVERATLAFRDYLREHAEVARRYQDLKQRLTARFDLVDAESQEAYAVAKTEFVRTVTEAALAAGHPRDLSVRRA